MKLKILKALEQGFNVMEKRPVILIPAVIVALLSAYIYYVAEMFVTSFLLVDETFVGFSSLASSIALIFIISELNIRNRGKLFVFLFTKLVPC